MWTYCQLTGELFNQNSRIVAHGYSGCGVYKNVPSMEAIANAGPIPRGNYQIRPPVDTFTHGPYVMRLMPDPLNNMYGRSGFMIHGDSIVEPGTASEGCIIMSRVARERIWASGDHTLLVVSSVNIEQRA